VVAAVATLIGKTEQRPLDDGRQVDRRREVPVDGRHEQSVVSGVFF